MSSVTRTGTRTGSRAASATETAASLVSSIISSALSSATRGSGHNAGSPTSSSTAAKSTSTKSSDKNSNAQSTAKAFQKWMIANYPLYFWWLIGAVGGFVALLYFASLVRGYHRRRRVHDGGSHSFDSEPKEGEVVVAGRDGVRSYRNVPGAISTVWNKVLYRFTFPTSLDRVHRMNVSEAVFCFGYLLSCLMFGFINNEAGPNSFANRLGWLAFAQTPFVVGLAGKNNVISYLTGIGPEKLNILHRAAGRAVLILSLGHAFTWISIGISPKHAVTTWTGIWGVVALVSFTLTTLLSFRIVRRICYEFFLISHIVLVCLFMVGCIFHKTSAAYWIYPSFALWAADRVVRLLRVLLLNRLWLSVVPSASKTYTGATVQATSDHTIKITMRRKMSWRAGQHVYLVVPGISLLPWEAHPFTIASAPKPRRDGDDKNEHELAFIVRARDGFTKRLMAHAKREEWGQSSVTAFVDGPYGMPPDLLEYNTVVLIAGGSGVSYTLSQLSHVIRYHPIRASAVQRVCFIWVIRQQAHISWIEDTLTELLSSVPSGVNLEIRVFVTHTVSIPSSLPILTGAANEHPESPKKDSSSSSIKSSLSSTDISGATSPDQRLLRFPQVKVQDGRPDLPVLIKEEVDASRGPVSVDVCGPNSLARTVRTALRNKEINSWGGVLRGRPEVELHVEQFGW